MARNKKEREEWRKKPALKPPQGVPHPPVHHYSHSSVSRIFHFQVLIYIVLTGALHNHAYKSLPSTTIVILLLFPISKKVATHNNTIMGSFLTISNDRVAQVSLKIILATSKFQNSASNRLLHPHHLQSQVANLCEHLQRLRNHTHRLELFYLAVLFSFCLSVSFTIQYSVE